MRGEESAWWAPKVDLGIYQKKKKKKDKLINKRINKSTLKVWRGAAAGEGKQANVS